MLICWVRVTPSAPVSTRKRSTSPGASPVRASTISAAGGLGEGHVALRAGDGEAVAVGDGPDLDARLPEAVLRLEPGRGQDGLAGHQPGQPRLLLLVAPGNGQRAAGQDGAHEVGRGGQRSAELLVEHHRLQRRHGRAAVLLGELQADEVEMGQLLPELGRVPDGIVLELADHLSGLAVAHTPRTVSRSISCSALKVRSNMVSSPLRWCWSDAVGDPARRATRDGPGPVMAATGRRGGSRGCRPRPPAAPPWPGRWSSGHRRPRRRCRVPPNRTRCRPPRCR